MHVSKQESCWFSAWRLQHLASPTSFLAAIRRPVHLRPRPRPRPDNEPRMRDDDDYSLVLNSTRLMMARAMRNAPGRLVKKTREKKVVREKERGVTFLNGIKVPLIRHCASTIQQRHHTLKTLPRRILLALTVLASSSRRAITARRS